MLAWFPKETKLKEITWLLTKLLIVENLSNLNFTKELQTFKNRISFFFFQPSVVAVTSRWHWDENHPNAYDLLVLHLGIQQNQFLQETLASTLLNKLSGISCVKKKKLSF